MTSGSASPQDITSALDAVRRIGSDVIAQVDPDAITTLVDLLPSGALLKELDAIIGTLEAGDARRVRRRAGLLGRLLGRDLVATARPDDVESRLRVHLEYANNRACELEAQLRLVDALSTHLLRQVTALQEAIARAATAQIDHTHAVDAEQASALQRRVSHLEAIAGSWRITAAQMAMAARHAQLLLDRHAQVRDVLVPLWRQQAAGRAVSRQLQESEASALRELQGAIHRQLVALRDPTLPHFSISTQSDTPSNKEPSP